MLDQHSITCTVDLIGRACHASLCFLLTTIALSPVEVCLEGVLHPEGVALAFLGPGVASAVIRTRQLTLWSERRKCTVLACAAVHGTCTCTCVGGFYSYMYIYCADSQLSLSTTPLRGGGEFMVLPIVQ